MLIRSQDRKMIVPLNRPICVCNRTIYYYDEIPESYGTVLGEYSSDARCLEIMDEIQAHVGEKTLYNGGIYQMPEK